MQERPERSGLSCFGRPAWPGARVSEKPLGRIFRRGTLWLYLLYNLKTNRMNIALKVKENLHIVGDRVISYNTTVARIENGRLLRLGQWSRTTTKHINFVAQLMGLSVSPLPSCWIESSCYMLPFGAKVRLEDSLSVSSSRHVAQRLNSELDLGWAIALSWKRLTVRERKRLASTLGQDAGFWLMLDLAESGFET